MAQSLIDDSVNIGSVEMVSQQSPIVSEPHI